MSAPPFVVTWRKAIRGSLLPPASRHVLLTLSDYMNLDGTRGFPGGERLANDTGLSSRTVYRALSTAVGAGFLDVVAHGGGRGRATHYVAALPVDNSVNPDTGSQFHDDEDAKQCHGRQETRKSTTVNPDTGSHHQTNTNPLPNQRENAAASGNSKRRRNRPALSLIPEGFALTAERLEWAATYAPGVVAELETAKFVEHHRSRGTRSANWDAEWRKWMFQGLEHLRAKGGTAPNSSQASVTIHGPPKRLTPEEFARRHSGVNYRSTFLHERLAGYFTDDADREAAIAAFDLLRPDLLEANL